MGQTVKGTYRATPDTLNDGGSTDVRVTNRGILMTSDAGTTMGTVAAGADAVANPTLGGLFSYLVGFNGTTWDRIRTAVTTVSATLTGFLNTLPWALYHLSPVTRTNGQGGPLETDATGSLRTAEQNALGWSFTNITTATTTVVKSGAGVFHALAINTIVGAATITIYDNTSAAGTKIGLFTLPAAGAGDMPDSIILDAAFATGLTIVTSGATDITAVYL